MVMKVFAFLIVLIAIGIGLGTQIPRDLLVQNLLLKVLIFREFFDAALPVLGFGALIKYLCTCCVKCESCHENKSETK
jgi:hypothetical protein